MRFTLNDGTTDSTPADVTVTSDTIYITKATDTATIDRSNDVSFSEAIAIAAADTTGTQTLVLASSLNNGTVGTDSASTLTESLTVNADATPSVTLGGGTLI